MLRALPILVLLPVLVFACVGRPEGAGRGDRAAPPRGAGPAPAPRPGAAVPAPAPAPHPAPALAAAPPARPRRRGLGVGRPSVPPATADHRAGRSGDGRRPATASPAVAAADSHALAKACQARAAWLRARLPRRFRVTVQGPFVVAGDLGPADFAHKLRYGVEAPARAMYASLFTRRPDRPVTILLLGSLASYRRWARQLLGDEDVPHFGYYKPALRTMIMNVGSGIGTLWHELTHALMAFDFPRVPDWLNEGLASLHEGAYPTRSRMVGVTNWRLPGLQEALFRRSLRPLRALVTRDDFYEGHVGRHYAHARFFVQYLQQQRKLVAFYRAFRDAGVVTDQGAAILERVLGRSLEAVDGDFRRWASRLRYGRRRASPRRR